MKPIKRKTISKGHSVDKNWRIYVMTGLIFFMALTIIGRLYFLQIAKYGSYVAIAENQHDTITEISAKRGEIFLTDENGQYYPAAVNRELQMVYAVPREMKDAMSEVEPLASILNLDRELLREKLSDQNDMFEILKRKLTDEETQKIREAKLDGIYLKGESFRYYPSGELAAQTIGFVGSNGGEAKGMYGLESFWEKALKGEPGMIKQEGDARGRWIPVSNRDVQEAKDGPDLILTINHTVQFEVEKIVKATMEKFSAEGATAVVVDPRTGKILAMANQPSFNPNEYSQTEDISRFINPAVSQPYESGSVFKAFTEAIGIDDGKINPETTYVDTGIVKEAGYEIRNSDLKAHGVQNMTFVLEESLNTGVIYIEKLVGNRNFAEYIKRFGFGEKTDVDLPGENAGNIRNLSNLKSDINFFTASFGQGITVTPLQLAMGYGVLANKGVLMKPQIVDRLRFSDGREEIIEPQEVRQVITESSASQMGTMLRSVVVNGHGKRADVPGYLVGGKTGTAQIAKQGSRGYEEGVNVGSFVGYAPVNDPQFVVVVKIINPKGVEWAESSAAPMFGEIMKFLLEYYKVKPTEDPKTSPLAKMAPVAPVPTETKEDANDKKEEDKKDGEK
ncbi:MAG: hypothetical protein ACD_5C00213G0003 [uncultured bacterium]|nr:MAG: hypothetical protein ACD_5C00213G0003 [uncultured bacterium]